MDPADQADRDSEDRQGRSEQARTRMMGMIVYEHAESVCCHKVRIVLAEKAIPHQVRNIALEAGEQLTPAFLAVNPKGVVPVIVDEGRTITESSIITEYLDDAYPQPPLMPKDAYWRSRRRNWARWIDDEMHIPHIATISFIIAFNQAFRKQLDTKEKLEAYLESIPGAAHKDTMRASFESGPDSERMRTSIGAYQKFIAAMDEALSENDWLAGPEYSLADIDVVPYIWRLRNLQLSGMWADRPRIQDWLDRVTSRPAFKTAVIDTALPSWIELMESTGREAWPTIKSLLR
ncbi:glutathione S-transferase family protein [Rhizorhabdus dicambivorans]|nr:glutathione S-transferase family protein [Rhizorhabdus dicambivorans]